VAHEIFSMTARIYLDNNATTPVLPAVWEAMRPFVTDIVGNPASTHQEGRRARKALEDAREKVAGCLGARADEVLFTSGATEANNLAIFGLTSEGPGPLLVSPIEHPCVIEPVKQLETRGHSAEWLEVDSVGQVFNLPSWTGWKPVPTMVALMLANHETGAIQPVADLAANRPANCAFHCDAVQAVGKIPIIFAQLGVDTLSISAHKFHGPRGIGALLVNRCARLRPIFFGGHQQRGLRPGTESVALAVGMATALEIAVNAMSQRWIRVTELRRLFLEQVQPIAPVINGDPNGLPHTLNLSFPGLRSDLLLMNLDLAGVACATGSACSSGSLLPSPVLKAMRVPDEVLRSALRFSFSFMNEPAEVLEAGRRVVNVVQRLRAECDEDIPILPRRAKIRAEEHV